MLGINKQQQKKAFYPQASCSRPELKPNMSHQREKKENGNKYIATWGINNSDIIRDLRLLMDND